MSQQILDRKQCPTDDEIQSFLIGDTSELSANEIESHLGVCKDCLGRFLTSSGSDRLTDALRSDGSNDLDQDQGELGRVIQKARQIFAQQGTREQRVSGNSTIVSEASSVDNAGPAKLDTWFLGEPEADDEIGRLGGYRILEAIGRGGMGIVYRAEDPSLGRTIAIKVMRPELAETGQAAERFLREARAVAALDHENIVPIFQVGQDRGVAFIAMPFLRGQTLRQRVAREGRLSSGDAIGLARQITAGLAAAHAKGIVHRDVKPDNIFLEQRTGDVEASPEDRVRVLDFGLACDQGDERGLTRSGDMVGTPNFMSPEQARGERVDYRSDLFSLGSVMYFMVSGVPPFRASTLAETLADIKGARFQPLTSLSHPVDQLFVDLTHSLLQWDPDKRPRNANAVLQSLEALHQRSGPGVEIERLPVDWTNSSLSRSKRFLSQRAALTETS